MRTIKMIIASIVEFFAKIFHRNQIPADKKIIAKQITPSETALKKYSVLIPFAVKHARPMPIRGSYENGYPKGAIVHYTAGAFSTGLQDAKDSIDWGISEGYTFLCIARTGDLVQAHPVNQWGYHAGESAWKGLIGGVSDDLIGIEMCNAGLVERTPQADGRFKTWFGTFIKKEDVRYVTEEEWDCPTGYYHKYSPEQEATLIKTILWLKSNDPFGVFSLDLVLGHHEVAGMQGIKYWRKMDPGGSLSMPMSKFREHLKSEYEKLK